MPTYEYKCRKCGKVFERTQKMADSRLRKCPFDNCGGKVERLISEGGGVIFKGKGFYSTDYRQKSPEKPSEKPCPAAADKSCPNSGTCPAAKGKD